MKPVLLFIFFSATNSAWAHEGQGLWGAHWHASDTLGFLAAAVGLAVWFSRK